MMENIKLLLQLYFKPPAAMSELMDRGSLIFAAALVLLVSATFFWTVNAKLNTAYTKPAFVEFYQPTFSQFEDDQTDIEREYAQAMQTYQTALAKKESVPIFGDVFFSFFSFDVFGFYKPLLLLSIFYVPLVLMLVSFFGGVGRIGVIFRRDFGILAICTLMAWGAAHLPFAIAGILLSQITVLPVVYFAMWCASSLYFGVLMVFALRTVFGISFGMSAVFISIAWLSLSVGAGVLSFISPWLFSPFLLIIAFIFLYGYFRSEAAIFGNAMRQRQDYRRFLQNATINPNDADAHVQLGLIYLQRRQEGLATEHFEKALAIDKDEIDANYELGKINCKKGEFQKALDHFTVVLGQNDKHALSEIWREVGVTYYSANMLNEARSALEKFIERRPVDSEGLYYLGLVLKKLGETSAAESLLKEVIELERSAPDFRRYETKKWSKLAKKEL